MTNDKLQAEFTLALQTHQKALETIEAFTESLRNAAATGDASLLPSAEDASGAISACDTVRRRMLAEMLIAVEKHAAKGNPFSPQGADAGLLEQ